MIINEKLLDELKNLNQEINTISNCSSLTDVQIENFLRIFEKRRYNILNEIKLYNNTVEFDYEKLKTIDDDYKTEFSNNILKIYIPEILPSYKNLKTHTYKRILLNVAENTKAFRGCFKERIFIYIKLFDKIACWDVDNKCVKPIADALILSGVIKDDNISKMFYCAKGEYSEIPHTEIYIFESENIEKFLENIVSKSMVF